MHECLFCTSYHIATDADNSGKCVHSDVLRGKLSDC